MVLSAIGSVCGTIGYWLSGSAAANFQTFFFFFFKSGHQSYTGSSVPSQVKQKPAFQAALCKETAGEFISTPFLSFQGGSCCIDVFPSLHLDIPFQTPNDKSALILVMPRYQN